MSVLTAIPKKTKENKVGAPIVRRREHTTSINLKENTLHPASVKGRQQSAVDLLREMNRGRRGAEVSDIEIPAQIRRYELLKNTGICYQASSNGEGNCQVGMKY